MLYVSLIRRVHPLKASRWPTREWAWNGDILTVCLAIESCYPSKSRRVTESLRLTAFRVLHQPQLGDKGTRRGCHGSQYSFFLEVLALRCTSVTYLSQHPIIYSEAHVLHLMRECAPQGLVTQCGFHSNVLSGELDLDFITLDSCTFINIAWLEGLIDCASSIPKRLVWLCPMRGYHCRREPSNASAHVVADPGQVLESHGKSRVRWIEMICIGMCYYSSTQ